MGLREHDLKDCIENIFEIDSYKSKMGDDKDICVLSFSAITEQSAKDLENFFEKGYPFVLDADATSGEQKDGTYKVFVEIERGRETPERIAELLDEQGFNVSGSDIYENENVKRLKRLGIKVRIGHSPKSISKIDLLVYSSAVPKENPEILTAKQKSMFNKFL